MRRQVKEYETDEDEMTGREEEIEAEGWAAVTLWVRDAAHVLFKGVVYLDGMLAAWSHNRSYSKCVSPTAPAVSSLCLLLILRHKLIRNLVSPHMRHRNKSWTLFFMWRTSEKCSVCIKRSLRQHYGWSLTPISGSSFFIQELQNCYKLLSKN